MRKIVTLKDSERSKWNPGPASEHDDASIAPTSQEVISYEVQSEVANALATVQNVVEVAVEQLFRAATLRAQGESGPWCTASWNMYF